MKIIKHRKGLKVHTIELYENIDEMPIQNFAQLEKNLIIESGVGTSINDFDVRFEKLLQFNSSGHKDKVSNEVNNIRNLFYNITNEIRPDTDAYSCLVSTINGKKTECTESGVAKTSKFLNDIGVTKAMIDEKGSIKKKMNDQLKASFPTLFDGSSLELVGAQKRKMIAQLDEIINDEDLTEKIEKENKKVSENLQSNKFGNNEGDDVAYMKKFNKMCMSVHTSSGINPKKLNVDDFYTLVENLKAA